MKKMKKIMAVMMAMIMTFALAACGGGGGGDKAADKKDAEPAAKPGVIKMDGYEAEYIGYELTKGSDDEDAIIIKYKFTNNSEDSESFEWAFMNKPFQNGQELEYCTVFKDDDSYDTLDAGGDTDIQPGNTIEVSETYALRDLKTPIEVEFESMVSDEKQDFEIDITK